MPHKIAGAGSYVEEVQSAGLGEHDQALGDLERAYQERSTVIAYLQIDPRLAPLRSEPRFICPGKTTGGSTIRDRCSATAPEQTSMREADFPSTLRFVVFGAGTVVFLIRVRSASRKALIL